VEWGRNSDDVHLLLKFIKMQRWSQKLWNTKQLVRGGTDEKIPNFPAYKTHHDFFVRNFRKKNDDECILISLIYLKKTGLLHILLQESKLFTSSDARSHDLEANSTISRYRCCIIAVRVFISLKIILTLSE
jgi:hypothetical protein